MSNIELPSIVKEIITKINKEGYEAYLVGGAVRDFLLSKENKDYDICTNIPLIKLKEIYPKLAIMKPNANRNTGVIRVDTIELEISEYKGKNIIEDLSNRDFTINAIAIDINGNIIDPFNGLESINKKEISLINKNGEAFIKDPLRIIRAIRIASKLNFNIEENCYKQMHDNKEKLNNIPTERIYRELIQLLTTDNPSHYIRENIEIFFQIIPEIKPMYKFEQQNKWHIYDILEHTLKVLENTPNNIYLRLAALFHDIGKPSKFFIGKDGYGHFYDHPKASEEIFKKIAQRLKMDNKTKDLVSKLIIQHDMKLPTNPEKIYEFLRLNGFDYTLMLFELKKADNLGQNPQLATKALEEVQELEKIYKSYILKFENLAINSEKILELGIKGKKIKLVIEDVKKKIIINNFPNTEEEIINYIKNQYTK